MDDWLLMNRSLGDLELILPDHLQPVVLPELIEWVSPPEMKRWLFDNAIQVEVRFIRFSRPGRFYEEHKTMVTYQFSDPNHLMLFKLTWC